MGGCCCGWKKADDIVEDIADSKGKVAIVTGPTTGIGLVTARVLARKGIHVILAGRQMERLEAAIKIIRKTEPYAQLTPIIIDCCSLKSVRSFVDEFVKMKLPLHYLINNAGIMACPYRESPDGFESQFATNHLGHFLLTQLLLPIMKSVSPTPARIICVASDAHIWSVVKGLKDVDNFNLKPKDYTKYGAYGNSKLANMLHALELERRLHGTNITAYSLHPGIIVTDLPRNNCCLKCVYCVCNPCFKSVDQGASTTIHCAMSPGIEKFSGMYFTNCAVARPLTAAGSDGNLAQALWELSEKMVNQE